MNDSRTDERTGGDESSPAPVAAQREEFPAGTAEERAAQEGGAQPGGDESTAPADAGARRERTPPPSEKSSSGGRGLGIVALLIALVAAAGAAFVGWQFIEQRQAAAVQRAEVAERVAAMRDLLGAAEQRLAVQEDRVGALSDTSEERRRRLDDLDSGMRQVRASLEALAQENAGPERSPSIAEIEFLLLLAGRELRLADNPRVALAALREADQRVARLEDPGLGEVRAAIHDEIAAVEAAADVDLEGTALRLASLARRVEGLPLRGTLTPEFQAESAADEGSGWSRFVAQTRKVASELFRVRRSDTPAAPLLAPDEAFFLYRNVELDLKSARLAVLARDAGNYSASLEAARRGLQEYFAADDDGVRSLLEAIAELETRNVAPEWPEISRSLALLRNAGAED